MAVVHKKGSPLFDKGVNNIVITIGWLLGLFVCYFISAVTNHGEVLIIGIALAMLGLPASMSNVGKYLSGSRGEHKVLVELQDTFTDDYHIFVNVKVHERNESDIVVVGPMGVFVFEVKNNKGDIEANESAKQWTVNKVGRGGGEYTTTMKNPLFQLKRNIYTLSQYLKIEKNPAWIEGWVCFPNSDTGWCWGIPDKCITSASDSAKNIMKNFLDKPALPQNKIDAIVASLEKCIGETPAMTMAEFDEKTTQLKQRRENRANKRQPVGL